MAIVQTATNAFKTGLLKGTFDFDVDVFYIALYTASANLNENTSAYVSSGEVSASGYSPGGVPLTVTVAPANANNVSYVSFGNVSWNAAITARGALIYKAGADGSVCVLDFGSDKTSVTTFQVQFPTADSNSAIIRIS